MSAPIKRVAVYCGSRDGAHPAYKEAAHAFGVALGSRGLGLVYGGAKVGLMGAVADGALSQGAEAIGVLPHGLMRTEFAHDRLTRLELVDTMHQRKALMAELADAYVALPGGFGTLDELFEILTLAQVGLHQKPVGVLDTRGYWAPLKQLVRNGLNEGFVPPQLERALVIEPTPEALLERLLAHAPPESAVKWQLGNR